MGSPQAVVPSGNIKQLLPGVQLLPHELQGNPCSDAWNFSSLFSLALVLPGLFYTRSPRSSLLGRFSLSPMWLPRGATSIAAGFSCVLWWGCWEPAGTVWDLLSLPWNSPCVTSQRPQLMTPGHQHTTW